MDPAQPLPDKTPAGRVVRSENTWERRARERREDDYKKSPAGKADAALEKRLAMLEQWKRNLRGADGIAVHGAVISLTQALVRAVAANSTKETLLYTKGGTLWEGDFSVDGSVEVV